MREYQGNLDRLPIKLQNLPLHKAAKGVSLLSEATLQPDKPNLLPDHKATRQEDQIQVQCLEAVQTVTPGLPPVQEEIIEEATNL